jgi:RNA polymerase sigma-70 factor (ECF subfamily)
MEKAVPRTGEPLLLVDSQAEGAASSSNVPALDIVSLVTEHHGAMYRYAFRLTGSAVDAEDLVQQAFLLAHQRLDQLREPGRAAGWLMTIVRNCFLKDKRRSRAAEPLLEEPLGPDDEVFPDWVDPEQLQLALNHLPEDGRVILLMYFFEDCSYKQIAESLQLPIGTVMSRLSRAKTRLRHLLSETKTHAKEMAGRK